MGAFVKVRNIQGVQTVCESLGVDVVAIGLASTDELGLNEDIVNVNGGAIALGHALGMSGARVVLTLALELKRRGGGVGAAALCGGGRDQYRQQEQADP